MTDPEYAAEVAPVTPSFSTAELLTAREAAELAGHPETVLAVYRSKRNTGQSPDAGPDFVKVGRAVFYPRSAVEAYVAKRG